MNGVQDMGGMQGMGPIHYEKDEPVFHEPWEGRVYAMSRASGRGAGGRSTAAGTRSSCCRQRSTFARATTSAGSRGSSNSLLALGCHRGRNRERRCGRRHGARDAGDERGEGGAAPLTAESRPRTSPPSTEVPRRATRAHTQHESRRPHAAPTVRAWEGRGRSSATTASTISRTRWRTISATNASTYTRCASPRASCGATPRRRVISVHLDLCDDYLERA